MTHVYGAYEPGRGGSIEQFPIKVHISEVNYPDNARLA
jgi:hypothetical protein